MQMAALAQACLLLLVGSLTFIVARILVAQSQSHTSLQVAQLCWVGTITCASGNACRYRQQCPTQADQECFAGSVYNRFLLDEYDSDSVAPGPSQPYNGGSVEPAPSQPNGYIFAAPEPSQPYNGGSAVQEPPQPNGYIFAAPEPSQPYNGGSAVQEPPQPNGYILGAPEPSQPYHGHSVASGPSQRHHDRSVASGPSQPNTGNSGTLFLAATESPSPEEGSPSPEEGSPSPEEASPSPPASTSNTSQTVSKSTSVPAVQAVTTFSGFSTPSDFGDAARANVSVADLQWFPSPPSSLIV